ncbi:MAG: response regulator [Gemmataceae bacterium]|nr:response regulator [Gemmataceae bacterium]
MEKPATSPIRILIADDNPQGTELLEAYLAETDFQVKTAADGEQTLDLISRWKPDILLLDIMMPRMSGFEVCKRLRANPETRSLPIIMVTALDQHADVERAVEAGTDDFISKPVRKDELLPRLHALLKSREGKTDLERTLRYLGALQNEGN